MAISLSHFYTIKFSLTIPMSDSMELLDRSPILLKAFLLEDIEYKKDHRTIVVKSGTSIQIDAIGNIALIHNEDHVHVEEHEYKVFFTYP